MFEYDSVLVLWVVVEVYRALFTVFQIGKVNWDMIQIEDKLDDEGGLKLESDEQVYAVLWLKGEDDREKQEWEKITCGASPNGAKCCDDSSTAIPIFQHLSGERVMFDINNLKVHLGP
jgi:hypothetical protein